MMSRSKNLPIYKASYSLVALVTQLVGQVIKPWRRVLRGRLLPAALHRIEQVDDAESRRSSANSYLGLMRQCSAYHERAEVSRRMLRHGHPVDSKSTRTFAAVEAKCAT